MKKIEMEKQQRYHNLFNEARNICYSVGRRRTIRIEEAKEVIGIIDPNVSYDEYVAEVEKLTGVAVPTEGDGLYTEYLSKCFVILISVNGDGNVFETAPVYKDDKDFLYHDYLPCGALCVNTDSDRAGWRDLRDKDVFEGVFDYFMNDSDHSTVLRYSKPEIEGDYSNQTPVVVQVELV